jgi:DNA repair photolyase
LTFYDGLVTLPKLFESGKNNTYELIFVLRSTINVTPRAVWMSGVCDPYQPLEKKYRLSRQCLDILVAHHWLVFIQTRSPLVLRDLDLLRQAGQIDVGLSVTTADDTVRNAFEPHAPSIGERVQALASLTRIFHEIFPADYI